LTAVETFRVGCIGAIGADTMRQAVAAIADTLRDMKVRRIAPALASPPSAERMAI
jgi:2-aminoethylphosphonate-pyruvate transaminase